jgi:hypothetical protein
MGTVIGITTPDTDNLQINQDAEIDTFAALCWAGIDVNWPETLKHAGLKVTREYAKSRLPKIGGVPAGSPQGTALGESVAPNPMNEIFKADPDEAKVVNINELRRGEGAWDDEFDEGKGWTYYVVPMYGGGGFGGGPQDPDMEAATTLKADGDIWTMNDTDETGEGNSEMVQEMGGRWTDPRGLVFAVRV